ncbi:hypothetical protein [Flavobacterium reichenbachii]|uniref:Uncharacterized protein n=1 Tax=Flavobacterium reichenbachii TaxID=362418 RepID=A0A085ZIM0_9FLAO|nr:hypothetical protein [Flavobacterium reichenbachii]KFF04284.1 hypothetical protein IW19_01525 [Flavobacterium reichenbachii]OXB13820.1 hypothetical protein B0A68_13795 [Flavobacterium reichenbachii]
MKIFFGHKDFKIKEFAPHELGFAPDPGINFNIEVRQKYFHIYWIPFFGTGKVWAMRRNGELYELPLEYHYQIRAKKIKVRSPWYTYTWPILIALGFLIYTSVEGVKHRNREENDRVYFSKSVAGFDSKIENPKTNEFFILENVKDNNPESKIYLKVEKVYADKILFTIVPRSVLKSAGLNLEDYYTQNEKQLDKITLSKSELKNAYARDFDVSQSNTFQGKDLLKSGKLYRVATIKEKFRIMLSSSVLFRDYKKIQISITSTGKEFTILSIKNIENTIPWDIKFPLKIEAGTKSEPVNFVLNSKEQENFSFYNHDNYKADLKILDSSHMEHTYRLDGNSSYVSIVKIN